MSMGFQGPEARSMLWRELYGAGLLWPSSHPPFLVPLYLYLRSLLTPI